MNAYAGSLAWSNFFSRLTHSHPGRVIWLVFNVAIALLLMELGIYRLLRDARYLFDRRHGLALDDLGRSLRQSRSSRPARIEFKRPIFTTSIPSVSAPWACRRSSPRRAFRRGGQIAASLAPYIALVTAFVVSPLIAWWTEGKFYLARKPRKSWLPRKRDHLLDLRAPFEPEDMAWCPPMRRRSARSAVRSTAAATTCASRGASEGAGRDRGQGGVARNGRRKARDKLGRYAISA